MTARRHDAFVATMLPYMQLEHEDARDRVREFTVAEARQLYMDDLPLLINHNDGEEQHGAPTPLLRVGHIEASAVDGLNASVLAIVDPELSADARFASDAIASGRYEDVSLGNRVETIVRASQGTATYVKTPVEVSLCRRGRRYGSHITTYCPGRATLERLARHSPDDLVRMAERHGYAQPLIDMGVDASDRKRYIEALATLSDSRLTEVVARQHLYRRPIASMSVAASETPAAAVAAPPAEAAPAAAAPPPAAVAAPPASRAVETSSLSPSQAQLQTMAEQLLAAKNASVQRGEELAAALAERQRMQEEVEKGRAAMARLAELEEAKKKKVREDFEQLAKSYISHAKDARAPAAEIEQQVQMARELLETNPDFGLEQMKSSMRMAIRAAESASSAEKKRADEMAMQTERINSSFLDDMSKKYAALDARDVALQKSMLPPTAYATSPAATPSASAQPPKFASVGETPLYESRASTSTVALGAGSALPPASRPFADYREKEPVRLFSANVRASETADADFPASDVFKNYIEATGRLPFYEQVAVGEHFVETGQVRASADGTEERIKERKRLRTTPAAVSPANFAPEWNAKLNAAMDLIAQQPNMANRDIRLKCTFQGNTGE